MLPPSTSAHARVSADFLVTMQATKAQQEHSEDGQQVAARFQSVLAHRDQLLRDCQAKLVACEGELSQAQAALEQQQAAMAALC